MLQLLQLAGKNFPQQQHYDSLYGDTYFLGGGQEPNPEYFIGVPMDIEACLPVLNPSNQDKFLIGGSRAQEGKYWELEDLTWHPNSTLCSCVNLGRLFSPMSST